MFYLTSELPPLIPLQSFPSELSARQQIACKHVGIIEIIDTTSVSESNQRQTSSQTYQTAPNSKLSLRLNGRYFKSYADLASVQTLDESTSTKPHALRSAFADYGDMARISHLVVALDFFCYVALLSNHFGVQQRLYQRAGLNG